MPAKIFNKEDLPVPLRPIKPTRSPDSSEKAVFARRSTWPKASFASVSTIKAMSTLSSLQKKLGYLLQFLRDQSLINDLVD